MAKAKEKAGKYHIQRVVALIERLSKQSEVDSTPLMLKLVKMKGHKGSNAHKGARKEVKKP
jgi:hypothetical protein